MDKFDEESMLANAFSHRTEKAESDKVVAMLDRSQLENEPPLFIHLGPIMLTRLIDCFDRCVSPDGLTGPPGRGGRGRSCHFGALQHSHSRAVPS